MSTQVPEGWKVSQGIRSELPDADKDKAASYLWEKSGGICALCARPLPEDGKQVDVDHTTARKEGEGGVTKLSNLYLAHKRCNTSRRNLPFELAKKIIRFVTWCNAQPHRDFNAVVAHFLDDGLKSVTFKITGDHIVVDFDGLERKAYISEDPATNTQYFFMNVPVSYIHNDSKTQPRFIEPDHVRTLAEDFSIHPVHEPSNCRFVTSAETATLFQFDGQHKTTAQMVLGRTEVPMKLYVDPNLAMLQELVVQIQQGIKKRPLSTTDTLRKLDDVMRDKVKAFAAEHGRTPTESELVEAQPKQDQLTFKKKFLTNLDYAVLKSDDFALAPFASRKSTKDLPFTDTVLVKKLIHPLMSQDLVDDEPLDQSDQRDRERQTVIHILNQVAENMLINKWSPHLPGDLQTRRARNFFYQGAIGFWMNELLLPSVRITMNSVQRPRLFRNTLSETEYERIDSLVETLCAWPIWSTDDPEHLKAFRSNTVANVSAAFPLYTQSKLMTEAQN